MMVKTGLVNYAEFVFLIAILSNVRELKVEQSTPYGSIIFKCCQSV